LSDKVIIDGDSSHARWIQIALDYLPDDIMEQIEGNLVIIGVGDIGGCRLPEHYREREIVLLSDWVFPPLDQSEGDETGQFFIITLLHEIAHALCRHKSITRDKLSQEEFQAQEDEVDNLAIDWFNRHVEQRDNKYLKIMEATEFREIVDRYSNLSSEIKVFKYDWHRKNGT
jgi:hypothetical protein